MEEVPQAVSALFSDLAPNVPVKEQGLLELKCGTVVSKKFKYYGSKEGPLRVLSSIPLVVQVRTPLVTVDLKDKDNQKYAFVKF